MGLGDTELDECLEGSVIANYWATTEEHCDVIKSYRETIRQAFYSGSTEHYDEKLTQAINDSHELVAEKKVKIEKAVNKGELKAIVEIRERGFDDGFKELTDKNRIRKIRDGYLRENHKDKEVRFTIHRDDFRAWLIKSKQWPLADGCLLAKWFEAEAMENGGADNETPDERQSQLYIFIWRVHQFLNEQKKPTAQRLWNEIQHRHSTHDTDKIIQEVDGQQILWCSCYGNEQKLLRSSFSKTLSKIRKTPPF